MKNQILIRAIVVLATGIMVAVVMIGRTAEIAPETQVYTSVDDEGKLWYITESKEFRYVQRGFLQPIGDREDGLKMVLFDIRTQSKWYQGMDGLNRELEITAHLVDEFGAPDILLWTIQSNAHEFWSSSGYDTNVYAVKYGCCGGATEQEVYDLYTGELVELREEVGRQPIKKWVTKKQ